MTNYKTLVAALIAYASLGYTAITHHVITDGLQSELVNVLVLVISLVGSVWGIFHPHKKG